MTDREIDIEIWWMFGNACASTAIMVIIGFIIGVTL